MSFKYLLGFSENSMIKIYFKSLAFGWYFNWNDNFQQRSYNIKNISGTKRPTIMALLGNSITINISADCYSPSFIPETLTDTLSFPSMIKYPIKTQWWILAFRKFTVKSPFTVHSETFLLAKRQAGLFSEEVVLNTSHANNNNNNNNNKCLFSIWK